MNVSDCGNAIREKMRFAYLVVLGPHVPVVASLGHDIRNLHAVHEVVGVLEHRPDEASGQVPGDVAVERLSRISV